MVTKDKNDVRGTGFEGKKPYKKPQLQIYGDLGSVTTKINVTMNEDGGNMPGADHT